jgi:hypothetical protein
VEIMGGKRLSSSKRSVLEDSPELYGESFPPPSPFEMAVFGYRDCDIQRAFDVYPVKFGFKTKTCYLPRTLPVPFSMTEDEWNDP